MEEESFITMGIDLGTTCSCVAIMEAAGPRVLTHGYNKRIFPSTFSIKDDVWHIGKHDITNSPDDIQLIHDVKRILGRNSCDGRLEADINKWRLPFQLDDDGNPFCLVNDERVCPAEFVSLLLLQAKKIVKDTTGKRATSCVITVPAYFSDAQRRATQDAANIAGIEVLRIINEPTAVAVAQLWNSERTGRFLVVDAGGGTIDCSKVNLSTSGGKKTFVVEATSGDNALGGHDFLRVLAELFQLEASDVPFEELTGLCEVAKKQGDDPIYIRARGKQYTVTQARYKQALKRHFRRVRQVILEALGTDTVEGVILAGGASCQQLFEECVREVLKNNDFLPRRPAAEVVAEGAAIMINPNNDIVVTDVLSRSLGINTQLKDDQKDDIMEVILKRNSPLPTSYAKKFTAVNEKETEVHLYEGERAKSSENNSLGAFCIAVSAGTEFKVTINVTRDAEIKVTAVAVEESRDLTVKRKESEFTEEEVQAMREKAQKRFASGADGLPTTPQTVPMKRKRRDKVQSALR